MEKPLEGESLSGGESAEDVIAAQQDFYAKIFEKRGNLYCPLPRSRPGFNSVVVVPREISWTEAIGAFQKRFKVVFGPLAKERNIQLSADDARPESVYAVRIRGQGEPDWYLKGLSGNELRRRKIRGITATEYIVFHLMYWERCGKHPDCRGITMCSGSVSRLYETEYEGFPCLYWSEEQDALVVDWCSLDNVDDNIMGREVLLMES